MSSTNMSNSHVSMANNDNNIFDTFMFLSEGTLSLTFGQLQPAGAGPQSSLQASSSRAHLHVAQPPTTPPLPSTQGADYFTPDLPSALQNLLADIKTLEADIFKASNNFRVVEYQLHVAPTEHIVTLSQRLQYVLNTVKQLATAIVTATTTADRRWLAGRLSETCAELQLLLEVYWPTLREEGLRLLALVTGNIRQQEQDYHQLAGLFDIQMNLDDLKEWRTIWIFGGIAFVAVRTTPPALLLAPLLQDPKAHRTSRSPSPSLRTKTTVTATRGRLEVAEKEQDRIEEEQRHVEEKQARLEEQQAFIQTALNTAFGLAPHE
ncbi:hypothetical protein BGZ47_001211 [Haplosporangium gracile]|nr:hypothetical protein BGZ47_001211 [Haplosporangium gracile]